MEHRPYERAIVIAVGAIIGIVLMTILLLAKEWTFLW